MSDLESVTMGFQLFASLPAGEDKEWALKPCMNSEPSAELDEFISSVIASSVSQLNFAREIKPLICKHTDNDQSSVNKFMEALSRIEDSKVRL